ncbi:unnamed protein product [Arctogadus glacialis]
MLNQNQPSERRTPGQRRHCPPKEVLDARDGGLSRGNGFNKSLEPPPPPHCYYLESSTIKDPSLGRCSLDLPTPQLTPQEAVLCSLGRDPRGSPHLVSPPGPLGPGPEQQAPWDGFGAPM